MLMLMHESEDRGALKMNGKPMPEAALASILGIDPLRLHISLEKIILHRVASRHPETGLIVNRRMIRDEKKRKKDLIADRQRQRKHRKSLTSSVNVTECHAPVTVGATPSSSSSSSSDKKKIENANAFSSVSAAVIKKAKVTILGVYDKSWVTEPWPSLRRFMALYNEHSPKEWPMAKNLDSSREKKIRAAIKDFPTEAQWVALYEKANKSDFLRFRCKMARRKGMDWLLWKGKDGTNNFVKIAEGTYRDE